MAGDWQQGPFRIPTFKDFVPHGVRFGMLIAFAFCFQFAGGVYLGGISQMMGGRSLMNEDVMMAAYSSFIGLTMTFPLLFRVKFRFKSRNIIMCVALIVALCNFITMQSGNTLVLCIAGFVTGMCRLIGTFECMSTLQGKLAPNHDQTIFFCILFCIILSAIQLSGLTTVYMDIFYNWEYMHLFAAGLMLTVALLAATLMRGVRLVDIMPFKGIDWRGMAYWSVFLLSGTFVALYGKYFDWFDAVEIRTGTTVCVVSFLIAVKRMFGCEQPYFNPALLKYRNLWTGTGMIMLMVLLLATPKAIEGAMFGSILRYENSATMTVNWLVVLGGAAGSLFSYYTLALRRFRYKWIIFTGFAALTGYQAIMYFTIDPRMSLEMFYLPSFLHGFGYTTLYVVLTLYSIRGIPFTYFLQPVGVLGFVRTGIGTAAASALVSNLMTRLITGNGMKLSMELDALNTIAAHMKPGALYGIAMQQATLVSMKQILGAFTIGGIAVLLLIITMPYIRPHLRSMPSMSKYREMVRTLYRKNK